MEAELEPPQAELVLADKTVIALDMVRDPGHDRPDCTYWRAVPRTPVEKGTYIVHRIRQVPRTGFWIDMELTDVTDFGRPGQQ